MWPVKGVLLAALAAALAGQQTYRERVDVSRVLVDVRVMDGERPLTGLTGADFVVTIDGKPAPVDSVEWVAAEDTDNSLPAAALLAGTVPPPRGRWIVFFYQKKPDLSEVAGLIRVERDLSAFENIVRPDDRVAIVSFDTSLHLWLDFTSDVPRVRRVMEHDIVVSAPPRVDAGPPPSLAARLTPAVERSTDSVEKALRIVGAALEPLPGAKSIVLLGYGFTKAVFDRIAGAVAGHYVLLVVPPDDRKGERRIDVALVRRKGTLLARRRYLAQ